MKKNRRQKSKILAFSSMLSQKKGQAAETATWIVATIIIIFVLTVSIFVSTAYISKNKKIQHLSSQTTDALASKSLYSYLLTKNSEEKTVYSQIKEEGNLSVFTGNLGLKIFKELFQDDYLEEVWLGITDDTTIEDQPNNYFGPRSPSFIGQGSTRYIYSAKEEIKLNIDKTLQLLLVKG